MVSDDTEHTCMVGQALCAAPNDPVAFSRQLASRMRSWLLGLPAGIGSATLRSTLKLWLGFSPSRSGVFSAGNGPAMRSPLLGAAIENIEALREYVRISTLITHTDPKACHGALAVALAAWCAKRGLDTPSEFFQQHKSAAKADTSAEFDARMEKVEKSLAAGDSTRAFAEQIGCGQRVSGYVYHTVPVVLHAWLSHPQDYRQAVTTVIECGGDTDTTAAIVGAIVGCGVGRSGIPREWLDGLWEWPRSVDWIARLAGSIENAVKTGSPTTPPRIFPLVGFARNVIFLCVVLGHAARRLFPPY
jgi:ADP-ribosylglycohydrolase